ncbi:hypothetical protein IT568_04515 [bacterium]|nr:hypothetical protein [bacterium]
MIYLILVLCFSFFTACGTDADKDTIPPQKPLIVDKSADTSGVETGIDAVADGDWIRVEWFQNQEEDVKGYTVYRSKKSGGFTQLTNISAEEIENIDSLIINKGLPNQEIKNIVFFNDSLTIDTTETLETGVIYKYYVRAFDKTGNVSASSDTISYQLEEKPVGVSPLGSYDNTQPVFRWFWNPNYFSSYVLKITDEFGNYIWIFEEVPGTFGQEYLVEFNKDGKAKINELETGKRYIWRVDGVGVVNLKNGKVFSGAESNWKRFTIVGE